MNSIPWQPYTIMLDLEVFAFDFKTDMEKLESDIKNEITAQASDINKHTRMVASGVVGQLTAEVHHMSYKMDALKVELDAQVDMLRGKLDKQTKLLKSVLCLLQILVMALMVSHLETVQPRVWVMVKQGFIDHVSDLGVHFIDSICYLGEFLPETPKT